MERAATPLIVVAQRVMVSLVVLELLGLHGLSDGVK